MKFIRRICVILLILTLVHLYLLTLKFSDYPHAVFDEVVSNGMGGVLLLNSHENDGARKLPIAHRLGIDERHYRKYVFGILAKDPNMAVIFTVSSILKRVKREEREKLVIIVLLTTTSDSIRQIFEREMVKKFAMEINTGMLEVVSPGPNFYKNNQNVKTDRLTMSCAYLMLYCYQRGDYYIHLDDTVVATGPLLSSIESFKKSIRHNYWILLDLSTMTGQFFRTSEIFHVADFFLSCNKSVSSKRLLEMYVDSQHPPCSIGKHKAVNRECFQELGLSRILCRPSLFKHNDNLTRLLNLSDEDGPPNFPLTYEPWPMDKVPIYINPPAKLGTTLRHHNNHSLERAYSYLDYFYAKQPKAGDMAYYNFTPPVTLEEFFIQCGNKQHRWMMFSSTTYVDVLPLLPERVNLTQCPFFNCGFLDDGYIKVARFDARGKAEGPLGDTFGRIVSLRIRITSDHADWIPVRHMSFKLQLVPSKSRPCCEPYWPNPFPNGIPGVKQIRD